MRGAASTAHLYGQNVAGFEDVAQLDGAWEVVLQAGRGAPASIKLQRLAPLSEQSEPGGVKYLLGPVCLLVAR